jgi:hypothetical protein
LYPKSIEGVDTIPQYAIMRFAKQKGGAGALEAHHERTKEKYASNPDIDTSRSKHNFHIIQPQTSYLRETNSRIKAAGCKTRKDSVRFIDTLITASPKFFKDKKPPEIAAFFETAVDFLALKIGRKNIFAATVHMDERTPHLHLCFTPITEDGRLSAKEIVGNRARLTKWQDDFYAHMVKAYPDLERGESASKTGRKHIPTRVFKQAVSLTKQAEQVQAALDNITPFNAGKKRDEAIAVIHKFIPQAEDFFSILKRYKGEMERQERDNAHLKQEVSSVLREVEASKPSIAEQMERQYLKRDYERLKKLYAAIPEDIRREAEKRTRKQKNSDRRGR